MTKQKIDQIISLILMWHLIVVMKLKDALLDSETNLARSVLEIKSIIDIFGDEFHDIWL